MGCRVEIIKFLLLLFNLLCMICCVELLVIAFPEVKDMETFADIRKYTVVRAVVITTIVMSFVVLLLSILGCHGALRGKPRQLSIYSIIMVLFFIMQLFLVIYVWTNQNAIRNDLSIFMKSVWDNHRTDNASKIIMHKMEKHLHCCGFESYKDYEPFPLPQACCGYENKVCQEDAAYKEGCEYAILKLWDSNIAHIKIGTLAVSALILLASTFSSYLAHKLRRSREIMRYD